MTVIPEILGQFLTAQRIHGPVLVAASGGIDSTALVLAFAELRVVAFEVAHVNHHLRGAESDGDQAFVRVLCDRVGARLHVIDGHLDADELRRTGLEAAAREVRYRLLKKLGFGWIATAHQKNDQAETILMRLLSGGSIAALRGIHPVRADGVIRPLLTVTRKQTADFLRQRGIEARLDRSNADTRFLRNRVRALLSDFDESAIDNLSAVANQAREQWRVLERLISEADTSITTATETRFAGLSDDPWIRRALLHRHIRRLDPSARDVSSADLDRLANATKRTSVTASLELLRRGDETILRKRPDAVPDFEVTLSAGDKRYIPEINATVSIVARTRQPAQPFQLPPGSPAHFTIRNRKNGDRFQPLGMARQKKLKDFLIDRKIPAEVRDRIPLLVWNGTIVWVGGVEISEAFKVTPEGGDLYEVAIEYENQEGDQRARHREPRRKAR